MFRLFVSSLRRVSRDGSRTDQDMLAVEAPLAIAVAAAGDAAESIGLFLRTPGDDTALALGLLLAEGVIRSIDDVGSVVHSDSRADERFAADNDAESAVDAAVVVTLAPGVAFNAEALRRSGVASTSCGLCGRIHHSTANSCQSPVSSHKSPVDGRVLPATIPPAVVMALPDRLREAQTLFAETGGIHAAGFFTPDGALVDLAEDVGRHNAVDKLVGRALIAGTLPARAWVLAVSGRVAFEIVEKAAMAGVRTLVAVGAPTSLAVRAAREANMTLIGFVRPDGYNVYCQGA